MSKKVTKSVEKMTLEEFFKSKRRMAIHCKTKEQSEILLKAFDEMGKTWHGGGSYLKENNWRVYEEETCYDNKGFYSCKDWYLKEIIRKVVEFEDIEFETKKILTSKEITKWILENCVSEKGDIILTGLDFGDKNVYINLLKTTGNVSFCSAKVGGHLYQSNQEVGKDLVQNSQKVGGKLFQNNQVAKNLYQEYQIVDEILFQSFQKVGGHLYQSSQEVGKDLFQSKQKVGGNLFQNNQEVARSLYQDSQRVNGYLYSHKLEKNEVWEEKAMYVVRKKVLKPITHKELAEMGFEIKD
jgi:hypothetical protein